MTRLPGSTQHICLCVGGWLELLANAFAPHVFADMHDYPDDTSYSERGAS